MHDSPRHRGFTLIELMVTVAVLAIVLSIAMPDIQQFIRDSRMTTQTNDLVTLINLARSQAVHEGHRAELCISADQQNCNPGSWSDGWLVWVDRNDNDSLDADEVARVGAAISRYTTTQALNSTNANFNTVTFLPTGFARLGNGVAFATLTLQPNDCHDPNAQQGRQITINASGAIKSQRNGCAV